MQPTQPGQLHPFDQLELNEINQLLSQGRTDGLLVRAQRLASAYPQNMELKNLLARLAPVPTPVMQPPVQQAYYQQPMPQAAQPPLSNLRSQTIITSTTKSRLPIPRPVLIGVVVLLVLVVGGFFVASALRDAGYKSVTLSELANNSSVGDKVSFKPTNYGIGSTFSAVTKGLGSSKPATPTAEEAAQAKEQSLLVTAYTDSTDTERILLDFTHLGNKPDTDNGKPTIYGTVTTRGDTNIDVVVDYYK